MSNPRETAYSAAKAAMVGLTRSLALEVARRMALFFECMGKCCRNLLDTAGIVRDACLRPQDNLREGLGVQCTRSLGP